MYGGTYIYMYGYMYVWGLSPRVRGNRLFFEGEKIACRSIPACTGEPDWGDRQKSRQQVYPRVYGGTGLEILILDHNQGLSPRVRGNLSSRLSPPLCRRSIPACTGEPFRGRAQKPAFKVYPRVYGGTLHPTLYPRREMGLSPRVRGNRHTGCLAPGIIGLSPRVRGNLPGLLIDRLPIRSIPACTGEPQQPRLGPAAQTVYPRVYGGTTEGGSMNIWTWGLSPRVRGNPPSVQWAR